MTCVWCLVQHIFFLVLFSSSEGWICWKGHGGKFILDSLPVHVWVFGQNKCVVQRNEPILAAPGHCHISSSTARLRYRSCRPLLLTHSIALCELMKAFRQSEVTADFNSNHIKVTTQGCSQLWAIFSLHLSVFLFSVFPPRSLCLRLIDGSQSMTHWLTQSLTCVPAMCERYTARQCTTVMILCVHSEAGAFYLKQVEQIMI